MGQEPNEPNSSEPSSPKPSRGSSTGNGTEGDHSGNFATGGQPSKAMAPSLQNGGKLLEAEVKKLMAERRRQKHKLFPQASGGKEIIQGSYRSPSTK